MGDGATHPAGYLPGFTTMNQLLPFLLSTFCVLLCGCATTATTDHGPRTTRTTGAKAIFPPDADWPKTWTVSWSIAAASVTNRPASYTGVAGTSNIEHPTSNIEELTVEPVNYYTLRDTRTNSFGQPYQTWRVVTNDLQFSAVVVTTNRHGQIGAFTR